MDKFEEYKFFAESTQFLTERRQNASQVFIGINAAILVALGFFVKDIGLQGNSLLIMSMPLIAGGIIISCVWHKMITYYKELIGWRYNQLMKMETKIDGCYGMYKKEWEEHFRPILGEEMFGFTKLEVWLPRLFILLYILYGIGLALSIYFGWL